MANSSADIPASVYRLPRSEWGLRDDTGLDWISVPDTAAVGAHRAARPCAGPSPVLSQDVSGLPHGETTRSVRQSPKTS